MKAEKDAAALQLARLSGGPASNDDSAMGDIETGNHKLAAEERHAETASLREASLSASDHDGRRPRGTLDSSSSRFGFRMFWRSLPLPSRVLLVLSIVQAIMLLVYAPYSVIGAKLRARLAEYLEGNPQPIMVEPEGDQEEIHIAVGLSITAVFFVMFVLDALWHENGLELLAALLLAASVSGRIIWFTVAKMQEERLTTRLALFGVVTGLTVVTAALSAWTYRNFGWRQYGQMAVDYRKKDADHRRALWWATACQQTFSKLDLQFLLILSAIGVDVALEKRVSEDEPPLWTFLWVNCAGLAVGLVTALATWLLGSRPRSPVWCRWVVCAALLASLAQPIANFGLIRHYRDQPGADEANAFKSLNFSSVLYAAFRLALAAALLQVLRLSPKVNRNLDDRRDPDSGPHPWLRPMMRGAWLGKKLAASTKASKKLRYFQLAQDGRTLRWGWKQFVRVHSTEAMIGNRLDLTITLVLTLDDDLELKFPDRAVYNQWERGLELLLVVLNAPGFQRGLLADEAYRRGLLAKVGFKLMDTTAQLIATRHNSELEEAAPAGLYDSARSAQVSNEQLERRAALANQLRELGMKPIKRKEQPGAAATPAQEPKEDERDALLQEVNVIDYNSLKMAGVLGEGAEGIVSLASLQDAPVAVKEFKPRTDSTNLASSLMAQRSEIKLQHAAGRHPNIVGLRGLSHCPSTQQLVIAMDYCGQGSLHEMLKDHREQDMRVAKLLPIIRGIAAGLAHLHSRSPPILHRDLKPGNIFVVDGTTVKIGDFGMSRFVQLEPIEHPKGTWPRPLVRQLTGNLFGTNNYAAPELYVREDPYERPEDMLKIDIFAFGATLWHILACRPPFENENLTPWLRRLKLSAQAEVLPLLKPSCNETEASMVAVFDALADLVDACRRVEPQARPSAAEVLARVSALCDGVKGIPKAPAPQPEDGPAASEQARLAEPVPEHETLAVEGTPAQEVAAAEADGEARIQVGLMDGSIPGMQREHLGRGMDNGEQDAG